MTKALHIVLIIGFLAADWLLFHDALKRGETYTFVEYLVGLLSLGVFYTSFRSLLKQTV